MELGPKDLEAKSVVLARRDTGVKETVAWADVARRVPELLEQIQVRYGLRRHLDDCCARDVAPDVRVQVARSCRFAAGTCGFQWAPVRCCWLLLDASLSKLFP